MTPLLQYPECDRIRKLLGRSTLGICFAPKRSVLDAIERLPADKGVGRITGLLDVLQALAGSSGRALASPFFQPSRGRDAEGRINKVCLYIQRHASEELSLSKIASLINLSESAFCKFFKRTMGRTFSDYLVDIRIGHACHLLSETDQPISAIAYGSGFDSLTYFNRVFLRKKGLRPREFRKGLSGSTQHGGGKIPLHRDRS
jgi:AraC-like DNA-binding protein